jgi:tRNA nucleotidyltransferase (CCA-adding enzyme)
MKPNTINNSKIPTYVTHVTETIEKAGFEAFLVGGCVRDLLMDRTPKDWDITTNARPEEIMPLFNKTIYENAFGTVFICISKVSPETKAESVTHVTKTEEISNLKDKYHIVDVTTYRTEAKYTDFRHPDTVSFSNNIEDDLKRRDFTINAMAYSPNKGHIVDLYKGQDDIKDKTIRAVGNARDRFTEDALRMLRAIRFSTQLDFAISYDTMQAIVDNSKLLQKISSERIHDEFTKIIESKNPSLGIGMLLKLSLLKYILPELEEGTGCEQGGVHLYDVFEHCVHALQHAADKNFSTEVRLAALFHDIGKPRTRRPGQKKEYTFYGHEVVGARMAKIIMERLKYPKKTTDLVVSLVRNHMFFSDTAQITLSAVRRIIQKVGKEHIWELMEIRECDRVGMKKAEAPYRLRKYHAMIEEVLHDPISVGQLALDGQIMITELGMRPSPRMGWVLHALLEEVLEDPQKNNIDHLKTRAVELNTLSDEELKALGEKAKEAKEELEEREVEKLHKKHGV